MISRVFLVSVWFVLAVVGWKTSFAEEIPSFVVRCKSGDADESCYKRQGQSLASSIISGYPQLKLETLDPFIVKILDFTTGGLKLVCKDVTFTGFGKAIVDKFVIDLSEKKLTMNVRVDKLDGTGQYKAGGRILVLPIEGEGKSDVAIKNMNLNMMYPFEISDKNGKQYINLKSVSYTWDIVDNVRFHFENLFNGNKALLQFTCGAQTRVASGWFTNPGFPAPSSDRLSCALALDKSNDNVLQIRLDFLYFELQPGTDGLCDSDQFMVSGHNSNSLVPLLCGLNNGQHMYIEVGDVPGPIYLSMQTITDAGRLFAIKVSQLTASDDVAPAGCLQYFTDSDGVIESFNYQDKSTLAVSKYPSYINNMNYAICVKRAKEQCSISYSNLDAEGQEAQFQILNYDTDGLPLIPPAQAGVEIFSCPDDFLALGGERLCGDKLNDGSVLQDFALNAPVTEVTAGPIVLYFKSDGSRVGRGFRLFYKQNPCTAEY